jgi:hypothetical protein
MDTSQLSPARSPGIKATDGAVPATKISIPCVPVSVLSVRNAIASFSRAYPFKGRFTLVAALFLNNSPKRPAYMKNQVPQTA